MNSNEKKKQLRFVLDVIEEIKKQRKLLKKQLRFFEAKKRFLESQRND